MHRLFILLLAIAMAGAGAPPAAPRTPAAGAGTPSAAATPVERASILPPESAVIPPREARVAVAPAALSRAGTLRIRAIGLSVTVYRWSCRDDGIPNRALRWGCSGKNNQFIFGHAYGVFRPYYLAWARHRLKPGMIAVFTDRHGRVTRYRLTWARKVPKSYIWKGQTGDQWAWGPTSRRSITLQTCWGATNKYRIITRFVER